MEMLQNVKIQTLTKPNGYKPIEKPLVYSAKNGSETMTAR